MTATCGDRLCAAFPLAVGVGGIPYLSLCCPWTWLTAFAAACCGVAIVVGVWGLASGRK